MQLMNSAQTYGSIAKFFHWTMALLIIGLLIAGFFMGDITDKPLKFQVYNFHKVLGVTVLFLAVLRLLWRWINPVPVLPKMPRWELIVERAVKFFLYVALFCMPLSGWLFATAAGKPPRLGDIAVNMPFVPLSQSLRTQFFNIHVFLGWSIIVLLCLHIAGVIKHQFINKDSILRRMMPGEK